MTFHFSVFHHAFLKKQVSCITTFEKINNIITLEKINNKGAWLAQSVEHATRSQGHELQPHIGCRDYLEK